MIDNELQPTKNFVLYTTPNGEVKLEVVSIWKITGSQTIPILETVQKGCEKLTHSELLEFFE